MRDIKAFRYNRSQRRLKPGWILVFSALVGLNAYLFLVRGIPVPEGRKKPRPGSPADAVAATGAKHEPPPPTNLGEMAGVAGQRGFDPDRMLRRFTGGTRLDAELASQPAGQRTLEQWCERVEGTIEPGDNLMAAMKKAGLPGEEAWRAISALGRFINPRRCRPGERFEALLSPQGRIERLFYHKSPLIAYGLERRDGKFDARKIEQKAQVRVEDIQVVVGSTLYGSMESAGERPSLVMDLVDIFAWDIDFFLDPRPGDRVRLVVEKAYLNGKLVRYGRILAAEYDGKITGKLRAFWYGNGDVRGYFDENGGSLRKAFLKSPLRFTRVSSGFGRRVHPILGFSHRHNGIDLAAPTGTPVWAPADGVVEFAGRKGASGNLVILRHANGYRTIFAHLNKIGRGIRKGVRVRQKQTIGTVGSTGRSTGPHLHYGMTLNGRFVNPFSQRFPPARPVPKRLRSDFRASIGPLLERLESFDAGKDEPSAAAAADSVPEAG
ncbi:MAG: M23 family metallopeptidase [Deltaproteobacteria bacterium]|nr:MAG: M23 family metallopeptidase [Deltaproteobacteria bacterium]